MKFNIRYFVLFLLLFITELYIAFNVENEFIRYVFGDYLIVILMYCFIKSIFLIKPINAAIITLIIAFIIEFLQLIDILSILNIQKSTFTKLVLGTTFEIGDLAAYILGVLTVLIIEKASLKSDAFRI